MLYFEYIIIMVDYIKTPIGVMKAVANKDGICSLTFVDENITPSFTKPCSNVYIQQLKQELEDCFP